MAIDFGGKTIRSGINVTPLVDVVLVLLIIFMVVTPLLQRGKEVALPEASRVSELRGGGEPILLSVTRDGRIWIDKREVPRQRLAEVLQGEMGRLPNAPVILKGDRELDYRLIRDVIRELARTRALGVSLAATRVEEGAGAR